MESHPRRLKTYFPQILVGLGIWGLVASLIVFTRGLPYFEEGAPGPRFMPIVLALVLSVLNFAYMVETFFFSPKPLVFPRSDEWIRPAGYFLIGLFMIFLWERLGVVATVLIASIVELKILEEYSWPRSILVGLLLSIFTWFLFQKVLGVPLPTGPFEWLASI